MTASRTQALAENGVRNTGVQLHGRSDTMSDVILFLVIVNFTLRVNSQRLYNILYLVS